MSIKKRIVASLENLDNPLVEIPEAKMSNDDLARSSEEDATAMAELSEEIQSLEDNEETLISLNDDIAQQAVNIQAMDGESAPQPEGDAPAPEASEQPAEGEEGSEAPVEGEPAPTLDKDSSDEDVGEAVMEENASLEAYSDRLSGEKRKVLVKSFGFESVGYRDILKNPRDAYKETHRQFLALRDASMEAIRASEGGVLSKLIDWVSGDDALWEKYSPGVKEYKDEIKNFKNVKVEESDAELSMLVTILTSDLPKTCLVNFEKFYSLELSKGNLDPFPSLPNGVKADGVNLKEFYPIAIDSISANICTVMCLSAVKKDSEGRNDVEYVKLVLDKPEVLKSGSRASELVDKLFNNMANTRKTIDPLVQGVNKGIKRWGSHSIPEMYIKAFTSCVGMTHELMQRVDNELGNNPVSKVISGIVGWFVGGTAVGAGITAGLVSLGAVGIPVVLGVKLKTYLSRGRFFGRAVKGNLLYYYYFHAAKEILSYFRPEKNIVEKQLDKLRGLK